MEESELVKTYFTLQDKLFKARKEAESAEDSILDEMDIIWDKLSEDERGYINWKVWHENEGENNE